uniref:Uncharacterized protein n=3 Tax=unclassified bacterial viruses TaxID=12333 RepID=A0AB39C516_9VIRU
MKLARIVRASLEAEPMYPALPSRPVCAGGMSGRNTRPDGFTF